MWRACHPTLLGRPWLGPTPGPARGISCRWFSRPDSSKASFDSALNHWNLPTRINQRHAGLIPYRDTERLVGHSPRSSADGRAAVSGQYDLPSAGQPNPAGGHHSWRSASSQAAAREPEAFPDRAGPAYSPPVSDRGAPSVRCVASGRRPAPERTLLEPRADFGAREGGGS